jgi:hypothetical protein
MERTLDTKYGQVTLRGAMLDVDGTNLIDGIEIKIDDMLIAEVYGKTFSEVVDMTTLEVESLIEKHT